MAILEEKDNHIVIIGGPNGAGKTTYAMAFLEANDYLYLSADDIAKELSPDNFDKVRVQAGKQFFIRLKRSHSIT